MKAIDEYFLKKLVFVNIISIKLLLQFRNLTKEMRMYAQKFIDKGKDFVLELAIKTRCGILRLLFFGLILVNTQRLRLLVNESGREGLVIGHACYRDPGVCK